MLLIRRAALAVSLSGLAVTARAHALVTESDPATGAVLAAPPTQVTVRFNSRIDRLRSRLTLVGADGVAQPLPLTDAAAPAVLAAPLPARLAPGAWRLRWQVLAADGHITRGDIVFTVASADGELIAGAGR